MKTPKMIDLASTGLSISTRLANKPKQQYDLCAKLSLEVLVAYEVAKNPHIFLTRENQQTQDINRHFDGNLNHFGPMVFVETHEQNESYTFTDILLQPEKSDFIIVMIKEVESD